MILVVFGEIRKRENICIENSLTASSLITIGSTCGMGLPIHEVGTIVTMGVVSISVCVFQGGFGSKFWEIIRLTIWKMLKLLQN